MTTQAHQKKEGDRELGDKEDYLWLRNSVLIVQKAEKNPHKKRSFQFIGFRNSEGHLDSVCPLCTGLGVESQVSRTDGLFPVGGVWTRLGERRCVKNEGR